MQLVDVRLLPRKKSRQKKKSKKLPKMEQLHSKKTHNAAKEGVYTSFDQFAWDWDKSILYANVAEI